MSEAELKLLLGRCIDPIQERIYEYKEERNNYQGYAMRQARFDRLIAEDEALLAEVRAALAAFTHWSKDPLVPYAACNCPSCEEARTPGGL